MSSPMYDIPEHFQIGVDAQGNGPREPDDPEFDRFVCWCDEPGCQKFIGTWRDEIE